VLRRYLPEPLFERPKQGFDVPIDAWLAGPLREWADELLNTSRIQRDGLLDAGRVTACWRGYLSGQREHAGELWAILMVQAWLELAFQADGQRSCNSAFEAA
jgi:asparagine synthase (glutamine-hydrolysing)